MSHNYGSTTYTPPRVLTPEQIQRQEMEAAVQRAMQMAEEERRRQLEILRRQHEEEIRRLEGVIQGLNSDHKASIKAHQKRLQELREQYDNKLNEAVKEAEIQRQKDRVRYQKELKDAIDGVNTSIDNLRDDTEQAIKIINSNIDQLQRETNQALAEQQAQINNIVAEIHQDKAKAAETKRSLIAAYQDILGIVNAKNHRKYAPRQLDAIQARLRGIDALPDDSACAILNSEFNNLLTLDANIEQARMEYEAKHLITLKAAEEVLARMHENRNSISLTDGDNNPLTDDKGNVAKLELDFWTEGEYGQLEKELEEIKQAVENGLNDPDYTTVDLDKALDRIAEINKRQLQLVIDSIERGNASQIRAEMADAIIAHLEGQIFEVTERGYENNDARNAYVIKLTDGASKIIIIINPESNTVNHVVIGTVETDLSEPELIEQGKEINKVLADAGIGTDGGVCNPRNPQVEKALRDMYDIDIIKEGIPQERKRNANIRDIRKERTNKA